VTSPESIAVVGASLAGLHAARTLRVDGYDGPITIVGDEPHEPYDRPPLSKQVLAGTWDTERIGLSITDDLELHWRLGRRAMALDAANRSLTLDDGELVPFGGLVIATGATPRRLPGTEHLAGVHVLRTLDDCVALRSAFDAQPRRVVVIGAGFIGAEVAATARERGLEVSMIEPLPAPLERGLGADMGMVLADIHREHGVDLRLSTGVDAFAGTDRVEALMLTDGTRLEADVVVVGIGVVPATDWLEGSGLTLDNGVVCDATCLAAPGIVAAGDVARWQSPRYGRHLRIEHWEHAIQQGEAAGKRLLADDETAAPFDPVPWFWSDQYDRKIQLAGVSAPHDRVEVVLGSVEDRRFVALYGYEGRVTAVLGMNRPRHVMQLRPHAEARTPFDEAVAAAHALD
jgi:3-phenylpropionate/trans-cinnamate dioxygenase ferredoxin reductase subunit